MYELMTFVLTLLGVGAGLEGVDSGKVYLGVYTQTREYGYVYNTETNEVYLDTVYEVRN